LRIKSHGVCFMEISVVGKNRHLVSVACGMLMGGGGTYSGRVRQEHLGRELTGRQNTRREDPAAQSAAIPFEFPPTVQSLPTDQPPDHDKPTQNRKPYITLSTSRYGSDVEPINLLFSSLPLRMQQISGEGSYRTARECGSCLLLGTPDCNGTVHARYTLTPAVYAPQHSERPHLIHLPHKSIISQRNSK
jgi:hypothetical protein